MRALSMRVLLCGALLFVCAETAAAQVAPPADSSVVARDTIARDSTPTSHVMVWATVGSAVGVVGGALLGDAAWNSGGEDPGLTEGVLGALIGSVLGSAIGAFVGGGADGSPTFGRALGAASAGVLAGLAFSAVTTRAMPEPAAFFFGYSVGQGVFTGWASTIR